MPDENINRDPGKLPQNIPEEIILPAESIFPETEILPIKNIGEGKDMEVHHHAYREHGRKSWKADFFEFFMLFLAVSLGFFVENLREHYVEREIAKQYLESMAVDVPANARNLDSRVEQDRAIIVNHDSLLNWLFVDSAAIDRAAFAKKMGAGII